MGRDQRTLTITILVCASALLISGCALRALFGNVIVVEDIEEEVNEIITTVFSDSTAAVCLDTDYGFYECTYIIDGDIITSTLYLLGEFGVTGVLIDPVILQVPEDVSEITATYNDGSGAKPLSRWITSRFFTSPGNQVDAEPGKMFIILELPPAVTSVLPQVDPNNAPEFEYNLSYKQIRPINEPVEPVQVKVMLAGKVVLNHHSYYLPTLPCVTDFASIPTIEIPLSDTPANLQPLIGDLLQGSSAACDHQAYYFNNIPPPPEMIFIPWIGFTR